MRLQSGYKPGLQSLKFLGSDSKMAHVYGWQVSDGCWLEAPFPSYVDPFIESLEYPHDMGARFP